MVFQLELSSLKDKKRNFARVEIFAKIKLHIFWSFNDLEK